MSHSEKVDGTLITISEAFLLKPVKQIFNKSQRYRADVLDFPHSYNLDFFIGMSFIWIVQ